jgi:hypothetical protein
MCRCVRLQLLGRRRSRRGWTQVGKWSSNATQCSLQLIAPHPAPHTHLTRAEEGVNCGCLITVLCSIVTGQYQDIGASVDQNCQVNAVYE